MALRVVFVVKRFFLFSLFVVLTLGLMSCASLQFDNPFENGGNKEEAPIISLLGPSPYIMNISDSYIDPGAISYDSVDGDLTSSIIVDRRSVDNSNVGTYLVAYYSYDIEGNKGDKTRKVIISKPTGSDKDKPILTLIGKNPITAYTGNSYTDPGAIAIDNKDGNLTDKII